MDIVDCIRRLEGVQFKNSGPLRVVIRDELPNQKAAYVSFDPLTIHIGCETWDHAFLGDPWSRFVLAHELGHAVLHDRTAKAFSDKDVSYTLHGFEEHSAEWQADAFALHVLMPDEMVLEATSPEALAELSNVDFSRVSERYNSLRKSRLRKREQKRYLSDICPTCGDFLARDGFMARCVCCSFESRSKA